MKSSELSNKERVPPRDTLPNWLSETWPPAWLTGATGTSVSDGISSRSIETDEILADDAPRESESPALQNRVVPPSGVRLFFQDQTGRACRANECYMWTWEGGTRWYYRAQNPAPGDGYSA